MVRVLCVICLIKKTAIVKQPCKHIFCAKCLIKWKRYCRREGLDFTCPLCRLVWEPSSIIIIQREDRPDEWPVDAILDVRGRGVASEYLVRWGDSSTSWEPLNNIRGGASELLREFTRERRLQQERRNWHLRQARAQARVDNNM